MEGIAPFLQPLEDTIRLQFLLSLTGHDAPTDAERELLALPACLGGLGLVNPTAMSEKYSDSLRLSDPLASLITLQSMDLGVAREQQQAIKATLWAERCRLPQLEIRRPVYPDIFSVVQSWQAKRVP